MTGLLALLLGLLAEPVCHLLGLPHPENLPALLAQVGQSTGGLSLARRR